MLSITTEPEFVNLLRSPGTDSQPVGPLRQPYLTYRAARLHRLAESIPWNRFLDSLKFYKVGLRDGIFKLLRSPGIDSKAGRYDNPRLLPPGCVRVRSSLAGLLTKLSIQTVQSVHSTPLPP
jgi:hypothetical protein